jgi:RNase P/RNase MRP subunit p29
VLVDKNEAAKVPAGAKKFEVNFTGGTLTISADGAEILKTPLAK